MDSQAIVNTMEVLETRPISELVSEAIIKVCYVSDSPNPNETVINREVGKEIAATLPGAPVAGFFDKKTGDFEEHSRRVTIQDGELSIDDITKAYGFVSPTDNPWYQDFEENGEIRTYLMCKAYFWTRQYEEASLAFNKGQSMELDEKSMSGYYQGNVFVFTHATLDKLCILGDAYAPCFSGAKIMTTYAKQYESLAEKLETTIGRRYYVMNDQLVVKPDKITLEYAIQLGWNLTDAVYVQLSNRGSEGKYDVQGIYTEGGVIFAILQDRESLEYVRCDINITAQDTVELASEMAAVQQVWTPKAPPAPAPTEPLNGSAAVEGQDVPLNVVATYSETPPADTGAPAEGTVEGAVEGAVEGTPSTEFSAEGAEGAEPAGEPAGEPVIDYAAQFPILTAQIAEFTATIAAHEATIEQLNATIGEYKKIEETAIETQKTEIVTSYSELLTADEMKPITEGMADMSVDALEAKLAVTYARKQKATKPAAQYQVNIGAVADATPDIPDFMKDALEFDKAREIKL